MYPSYLEVYHNGNLKKIIEKGFKILESCCLCPRRCRVNRINGQIGYCKTGVKPRVCSYLAHSGEEPPVSGKNGSGTIFFSYCNMACAYCQNYEFSQLGQGKETDFPELAGYMLKLQEAGCHNINLVTPTHVMPQILKALSLAIQKGLKIPLVYNTGGYELAEIIKMLEGIVDIYLADMRYAESEVARKYSDAADYPLYNQEAIKEMQRQAGVAQMDDHGIIIKGLIIRHLVLPNNLSGTEKIMRFLSQEISKETYLSLMSQYTPYYRAAEFKEISRRISPEEYAAAKKITRKYGLDNGWSQEAGGLERFAGVNIKPNLTK